MAARQQGQVGGGLPCRRDRGTDRLRADGLPVPALAVLRVGEVVAERRDADLGQSIGDRLQRGMPHVRAGAMAEYEEMRRALGPYQEGRDLALLRRGEEL